MMTDLKQILATIDQLQAQLEALGPLGQDQKERLAQKVRLEWNYHSNVIEGNQLDWGETRSLLLHGLTANGKPLKDHLDMKGHNEALKKLEQLAGKEVMITENLIKDFHTTIIEDPFKEYPEVEVGQYKGKSNYLYNQQGERIDFTPPAEVPAQLNALINWTNNHIEPPKRKQKRYDKHPLLIAAIFHMRFINIHPFDDGNGRVCRIMMNIILIQCGFPPIIIRNDDRKAYFQAIDKAREEGEQFLALFLGNALIASLELYLKAAKGEALEAPDDLDKKLALLEKELEGVGTEEEIQQQFSKEVYLTVVNTWFADLLRQAIPTVQKFNRFFVEAKHYISGEGIYQQFANEPVADIMKKLSDAAEQIGNWQKSQNQQLSLRANYSNFKKGGLNSFDSWSCIELRFDDIKYKVRVAQLTEAHQMETVTLYEKLYHQPLLPQEIDDVIKTLGDSIFLHIDHESKKAGLR